MNILIIKLLLIITTAKLIRAAETNNNDDYEYFQEQQYLISKLPLNNILNINKIVYHKNYVYIGAQNQLLKVNSQTFKIEQTVSYGPVNICNENRCDNSIDNYNKLLIVYSKQNVLISCWTYKQGVCDARDLNDINTVIQNSSIAVVANDPLNSTVGFISQAANSQDLLYVATTYNGQNGRQEVPAMAGRMLNLLPSGHSNRFMTVLSSDQGLKSSKAQIEFTNHRFQKTFIVKYVHGFNLGIYNYFLNVQHMDSDAALRGDYFVTKVGRLCQNDLSFVKSYIEMPLKCSSVSRGSISSLKPIDYNELISAKLIQIRTRSLSESNEYYIAGLFQQTTRNTFNASIEYKSSSDTVRQAVCLFPLKQIQSKIKENLQRCYNSGSQSQSEDINLMRGLNFIKPDQQCSSGNSNRLLLKRLQSGIDSSNSNSQQITDDFCSSADNDLYPIGGQIPAVAQALLEFDTSATFNNDVFDQIQIYSDRRATALVLLSSKRNLLKFYELKSFISQPVNYRTINLDKLDIDSGVNTRQLINSNLVLEETANSDQIPNLLVQTTGDLKSLLKIRMSSCENYRTCSECLQKSAFVDSEPSDPFCGWCPTLNQCTTRSTCLHDSSKWINGADYVNETGNLMFDSVCVDITSVEPSKLYRGVDSNWIEINFRKELYNQLNESSSKSGYQCVFLNDLKTDAVQISSNKLKCSLPHSSKLSSLFQKSVYTGQSLVLSEDGIFRVSPDSVYYYETAYDRITLPIYVQNTHTKPPIKYGTLSGPSGTESLFNLTVIDCSAHKSCISCSNTPGCGWCGNKCSSQISDQCISNSTVCQSFDTGTTKLLIPYTAHRQQAPIVFQLSNMQDSQNGLQCLFTMFNGKFADKNITLPFLSVNKTHAHCVLTNVFSHLSKFIDSEPGQVQTNLRLYDPNTDTFVDSISNGKLSLLFYKCEIKADDCNSCISLNRQFSCMWCNMNALATTTPSGRSPGSTESTCRFMNSQSKLAALSQCISPVNMFYSYTTSSSNSKQPFYYNQCDKPEINVIEPSKLPIGGGTVLTIKGVNLGTKFEDLIGVYINCGDKYVTECDLDKKKYVPLKQIVCVTRQNTVKHKCRVNIKLRVMNQTTSGGNSQTSETGVLQVASSQVVDYVDPVINTIEPQVIIQSAYSVWLNIRGTDLDAGKSRFIYIYDSATTDPNGFYQSLGSNSREIHSDISNIPTGKNSVKCEIKNVTGKEIKCRLNSKFLALGQKNVHVKFDDNMSIVRYFSIRVQADPLIKSIDKQMSIYAGGGQFHLYGFNFNAVQSAYTYIAYKNEWYSEPQPARERLSNEVVLFDFPTLNDAFFQLVQTQQIVFPASSPTTTTTTVTQPEKYDLQIGFIMDGFNVTLKDIKITYLPNPTIDMLAIKSMDIKMMPGTQFFGLIISFDLNRLSREYSSILRDDLQIFVGCSVCQHPEWSNDTTSLQCQLPTLDTTAQNNQPRCESKVIKSIVDNLNKNDKSKLINVYLGNHELPHKYDESQNENIKIYLQTYVVNDVDSFSKSAQMIVQQVKPNLKDPNLINYFLKEKQILMLNEMSALSTGTGSTSRNLLLLASIITSLLILLILFTIVLVTIIFRMKRKCSKLENNTTASPATAMSTMNPNSSSLVGFGANKKKLLLLKRAANSFSSTNISNKKNEKQLRAEFERIQEQIDLLETNIKQSCAHLFQQLHQDYINEFNHECIYTLGVPIWNYKTYLYNLLFPKSNSSGFGNLLAIEMPVCSGSSSSSASSTSSGSNNRSLILNHNLMSSSSMSNSTTNTLLSSTLTPIQKQQQQQQQQIQQQMNATMSVYATIKSSSMLRFDNNINQNSSNPNNVTEAMYLFGQLIHNKNFLLTFIQVCEKQPKEKHQDAFTSKDRQLFASLLTLALKDNLSYLYSIIKCLLADYISASFKPTSPKTNNSNLAKSKLLFRSNEYLIEPLLTNWISMFMYDFQRDTQSAQHLYRLVKVLKFYIMNMGPVDQEEKLAFNSLSEEKLLKPEMPLLFKVIYVNVLNQTQNTMPGNVVHVCRLMDCDTINQAKEKILDYLFKSNGQFKPKPKDVDLELCLILIQNQPEANAPSQQTTLITLKETEEELIGTFNSQAQNPTRLLTLKDYNIQNGSFINITLKPPVQVTTGTCQNSSNQQSNPQHVYMSTLSMNNEYLVYASNPTSQIQNRYHLLKPTSSSESTASSRYNTATKQELKKKKKKKYEKLLTVKSQDSAVTTASLIESTTNTNNHPSSVNNSNGTQLLTRLLMNKGTVQPFIDQFIENIFANTSNLPPVIQHLFEFFDQEIKKYQYNSSTKTGTNTTSPEKLTEVTKAWKTNSYFLRYWANVLKNPNVLLDNCSNKSNPCENELVDSSLTCIAQAFVDSCNSVVDPSAAYSYLYDSSSTNAVNRVLFVREVPKYKQMINSFYDELKSYQPISDHELHFYLNEFTKCQQQQQQYHAQTLGSTINQPQSGGSNSNDLNSIQVLMQLYEFYEKYETQINAALGQQQCSILLPVHHRLVQIKDLIMNNQPGNAGQSIGLTMNTAGATLHRPSHQMLIQNPYNQHFQTLQSSQHQYQQPCNFYATTCELNTAMGLINNTTNNNNNQSFTTTLSTVTPPPTVPAVPPPPPPQPPHQFVQQQQFF